MSDLINNLRSLARFEHADLSIGDEAADEIKRLRAKTDTAYLEGVKAGLEAAKDAIHKAESEEPADEIGFGLMEARNLVAALDPTTITRKGGADG